MNKKLLFKLLAVTLLFSFIVVGCQKQETANNSKETTQTADVSGTRTIVDSVGREVEIPNTISKIAPSGPLAQIVLYTSNSEKLAGLAKPVTDNQKEYLSSITELPIFGQFYGKNSNLNMEELIKNSPDLVIDIGEAKKTIVEDMDNLQNQINIPVVFVEASLETMADAYQKLGEIIGDTSKIDKLAEYSKNVIESAKKINIPEKEKISVYWAMGDAGLNTNAKESFHAEVLNLVGAKNVAEVEAQSKGGGSEISMEQLIGWNPQVILADNQNLYDMITTDPTWSNLDAVKNGKIYRVPSEPYGFLADPPSVNRIIGITWLGNLLYPEKYDVNIKEEVKDFYKLFYNYDLKNEQIDKILENSISK